MRNPFGEPLPGERAALAVVDVEPLVTFLTREACYIEFTGEQGRGKTTRLHALHERLDDASFIRIPEDPKEARRVDLPRAAILLVDDAQFLNSRQRKALFRRASSVATATHDSLVSEARAAGFDVREIEVRGLDRSTLRAILERRIEWARRDPGEVPTISDGALVRLIERFEDDLRTIEDVLYSVFQNLEGIETIDAEHVERTDVPEYTTDSG